ncbi:uncharacterized protein LOC111829659 [Capsella rubella]|uniref:uncharacterized protein LOC111829659 n=1 Tax=Capsella rubella TaxID=81985 RepID=UPI000CD4B24F|nr:uncharacterized protein LOC111829659 [Capsella rubella]XP_023635219.1 uncharacterized protein LOC111829659 [Capsella rubella]
MGEPYGDGSVKLSSYLGILAREHVPIILECWPKLPEASKTLLMKSIQARFDVDVDVHRNALLTQIGSLWRSSKSRTVKEILEADNTQQRMNLRPRNVSPIEWRRFVKQKTSPEFKVLSDSYKERRNKQIPHTCSRKGMVRLTQEMKNESLDPSEVDRLKVWIKSRTKKDGTPVNNQAAEKIKKASEIVNSDSPSSTTNPGADSLARLLGPDNPGRMRAMGRNITKTKLACLQVNLKCMNDMQDQQVKLVQEVNELRSELAKYKDRRQEPEVGENSAARSVNKKAQPKCLLVDWFEDGSLTNVAEGRIYSTDPLELVNDSPLGPSDLKVLVETAIVPRRSLEVND